MNKGAKLKIQDERLKKLFKVGKIRDGRKDFEDLLRRALDKKSVKGIKSVRSIKGIREIKSPNNKL